MDDYVEISDSPSLDIIDQITIEAWICQRSCHSDGFRWSNDCGINPKTYRLCTEKLNVDLYSNGGNLMFMTN